MRRFLFNIIIVGLVAATILSLLTWMGVRRIDHTSFRLPDDIHLIAFGPSTMQGSVNDTLIAGLINFSRDGTTFKYTVPLLPRLLEENPQIDTVYISHGRFLYMPKPMIDATQEMQYIRDKLPFIWYKRYLSDYGSLFKKANFYAAILNSDLEEISRNRSSIMDYGFHFYSDASHNLKDSTKYWSIAWYDSITEIHGGNVYTKEELLEKNAKKHKYVLMAISICKSHNVVPVLFFTPLYHYDRWLPYDEFCEIMKDYDPELLVADYENFEFSDDSLCRRDVHHLNIWGANEFSKHLAKNGIQTVKLKDWISSKTQEK